MRLSKDWIERNFQKYNKLMYDKQLRMPEVKLSMSKHWFGTTIIHKSYAIKGLIDGFTLTMSTYYNQPESVLLNTLLHEMVHIADFTFHPDHAFRPGYRSHGNEFFRPECKRIEELIGICINSIATEEEIKQCKLSKKAKELEKSKYTRRLTNVELN